MNEAIIIGGGSSIQEGVNLGLWDQIKGREIWSINFAFKAMPYLPTREIWSDLSFYSNNLPDIQDLFMKGVKLYAKANQIYVQIPYITQVKVTHAENEESDEKIYVDPIGLTGMMALAMAVREKKNPIFLLGYDFCGNPKQDTFTHFYQYTTPTTSHGIGRPGIYIQNNKPKKSITYFDRFKDYQTIYNVSPFSKIEAFPKITYEEFFTILKGDLN